MLSPIDWMVPSQNAALGTSWEAGSQLYLSAAEQSALTTRMLVLPLLLVLAAGTASAFETADLPDLVPSGEEGYQPDPGGPYLYLSSANLTGIYDGGYLTYVDRGVVSAVSQIYAKDSDYYQIVIHDMNSAENASGIVSYFYDLFSGDGAEINVIDLGDGGFQYKTDFGMNYLYYHLSDLFITLEGSEGAGAAIGIASEDIARRAVQETFPVALLAEAFLLVGLCQRRGPRFVIRRI